MANAALEPLFDDYARYHRNPANKLCHYIGIPLIVFTLVGLLYLWTPLAALLVAAAALVYQLRLSPKLTAIFGAFVLVSFLLAPRLDAAVLWGGFLGGWALQFLGHYAFEKKSPAFFKNLQQLLVGPLWILGTLGSRRSSPREAPGSSQP